MAKLPTNRVPRALADRCAVCGRPLSKPGRVMSGIGVVGPECYRKFSALEDVLSFYGAEELAYGGCLEVSERASLERIQSVHELIMRLRRAGLRVEIEDAVLEDGTRAKRIRLAGVAYPRTFRRSFKDVWKSWADDLRLRAMEREFGTYAEVGHA